MGAFAIGIRLANPRIRPAALLRRCPLRRSPFRLFSIPADALTVFCPRLSTPLPAPLRSKTCSLMGSPLSFLVSGNRNFERRRNGVAGTRYSLQMMCRCEERVSVLADKMLALKFLHLCGSAALLWRTCTRAGSTFTAATSAGPCGYLATRRNTAALAATGRPPK